MSAQICGDTLKQEILAGRIVGQRQIGMGMDIDEVQRRLTGKNKEDEHADADGND